MTEVARKHGDDADTLNAKVVVFAGLLDRATAQHAVHENPSWEFGAVMNGLLDLAQSVPDGASDTDLKKLLVWTWDLNKAIQAGDEAGALEFAAYCRLGLLRLADRITADTLEDPATAFVALQNMLPSTITVKELAEILGVSDRTVSTWRKDHGASIERRGRPVVQLAQMAAFLRDSMTPTGILLWLRNPLPILEGRSPLAAVHSGDSELSAAALAAAERVRG